MQSSEQDIDLSGILRTLWHRRWWVLVGVLLGAIIGVVLALEATPMYRAEVLLLPVKKAGGGSGLESLAGQFGGLASLAGIDVGGSDDAAVAVATLKSHRVTSAYIEKMKLLPILYAARWDAQLGRWKSSDPKKIPTVWSAERFFNAKIRKIAENRTTGLVTMTIEWSDPNSAAQWAHDLVMEADNLLRTEAHDTAQRNIDFLEKQLQATNIVEVRQTLNHLLEEQWNKLMLAQGDSDYAFRVIDPAVVPKTKSNLPRSYVVVIWTAVGFILSCAIAIAGQLVWSRKSGDVNG
jgi:uncharacterized protein involved in exopolysaccharide biosynthesis